jgi:cytochrome c553
MVLYSSQEQPFRFSHAVHTNPDIGIEGETEQELCGNCHEFRDDGTFAGIPKLETCTMCHDDPDAAEDTEYEELKVFLRNYVAEDKEVPWLVYSRQPECVYFSHIAHVKMGEISCGTCHGDHGKSEELLVYKENRLTGYSIDIWGRNIAGYKVNTWDRMKMDDCAECHTEKGHENNNACFVCHK